MKFNWQVFYRVMAGFAILDACLLMAGCGDWESQAISLIALIGPAVQSLIAILAALGVKVPATVMTTFSKWSAEAQNDLLTLKSLIQQVKDADAATQPELISKIQAAVGVISQSLETILPELHIEDADSQARVAAAFQAVIGFLGELAILVPAIKPSLTVHEAKELHSKSETAKGKFKAAFNKAVEPFGKQYCL